MGVACKDEAVGTRPRVLDRACPGIRTGEALPLALVLGVGDARELAAPLLMPLPSVPVRLRAMAAKFVLDDERTVTLGGISPCSKGEPRSGGCLLGDALRIDPLAEVVIPILGVVGAEVDAWLADTPRKAGEKVVDAGMKGVEAGALRRGGDDALEGLEASSADKSTFALEEPPAGPPRLLWAIGVVVFADLNPKTRGAGDGDGVSRSWSVMTLLFDMAGADRAWRTPFEAAGEKEDRGGVRGNGSCQLKRSIPLDQPINSSTVRAGVCGRSDVTLISLRPLAHSRSSPSLPTTGSCSGLASRMRRVATRTASTGEIKPPRSPLS